MRGRRSLLVGRSVGDVRAHDDERRSGALGAGCPDRLIQCLQVVGSVADVLNVPAIRLEPPLHIVGQGELGAPLDRDTVVVVDPDQLAQTKVARQRGGLV